MDQNSKTMVIVAGLVISLFLGINYMVAEEQNSNWLITIAVLLAIVIFFWLWVNREEKKANSAQAAAKAMDEAETVALKAGDKTASVPEKVPAAETAVAKEAEVKAKVKPKPEPEPEPEEAAPEAAVDASEPEPEPEPEVTEPQPEPEPEPEVTEPEPEPPAVTAAPVAESTGEPDDLTKVEGIGPKYRDVLLAAGIDTYEKLSQLSEDEIVEIIKQGGARKSASISTWAEQAKLAAAGDWDALQALQDQLSGGRR